MKCVICGNETTGSVGAAGIHWSCICQPCKDVEDNTLKQQIVTLSQVIKMVQTTSEFIKITTNSI